MCSGACGMALDTEGEGAKGEMARTCSQCVGDLFAEDGDETARPLSPSESPDDDDDDVPLVQLYGCAAAPTASLEEAVVGGATPSTGRERIGPPRMAPQCLGRRESTIPGT